MQERKSTEERQFEIAQATVEIISREGLGRFTTSRVAEKVGISEGAIFRHFKSKEEIINSIIDTVCMNLKTSDFPQLENPIERLLTFLKKPYNFISKNPDLGLLLFTGQLGLAAGSEGNARIENLQTEIISFIQSCLSEGVKRKLIPDYYEPLALTVVIKGSLTALANRSILRKTMNSVNSDELSNSVYNLIENILTNPFFDRSGV